MVDFLCIGAQKSGTTLLYEHLKQIEEIYLPDKKELHYFDKDNHYYNDTLEYSSYFTDAKEGQVKGEITPSYLFFEKVPYRIKTTVGDNVKFILLLRNPITRAYSHYNMTKKNFLHESLSFDQALIAENHRLNSNQDIINFSYQARGFYSQQIFNYFKHFDKKQFKFILYEQFIEKQSFYINNILNFLEINREITAQNMVVFKNDYNDMNRQTKEALKLVYKDEINRLENLLDLNLDIWRQG